MKVAHHHASIAFPASNPPSWAGEVERWYQLDPYAYALPEAFARWNIVARPASMLLACAGASNETDYSFVQARGASPTKFVHTLPNIRASSLLAVMQWAGPLYSLHRDPYTLDCSFQEAIERAREGEECWVWSVTAEREVDLFRVGVEGAYTHEFRAPESERTMPLEDMAILRSFWDSVVAFEIGNWAVRKE